MTPAGTNLLLAHADAVPSGDVVTKSLRFNLPDSPYLSRTFGTGTSTTVCTFSFWVKLGESSDTVGMYIFDSVPATGDEAGMLITGSAITGGAHRLQVGQWDASAGSHAWLVKTNALFRDYAGW